MSYESTIEAWRALKTLNKEGRVKGIGVSNFQISYLEYLIKDVDNQTNDQSSRIPPTFNPEGHSILLSRARNSV